MLIYGLVYLELLLGAQGNKKAGKAGILNFFNIFNLCILGGCKEHPGVLRAGGASKNSPSAAHQQGAEIPAGG